MTTHPWYILIVEDDEDDFILTSSLLKDTAGGGNTLRWVSTYNDALETLSQDCPDVVLVDYHLGAYNGVDLLRAAKAQGCRSPFILLTGQGNDEIDMQALQAGFSDYLVKSELNPRMLERAIRYAIEHQRLLHENQQQKDLLEAILETDPGCIAVLTGPDLVFQFANPAYRRMLPGSEINPISRKFLDIWPVEDARPGRSALLRVLETGVSTDVPAYTTRYPDGTEHIFSIFLRQLCWNDEPAVLMVLWETTVLEQLRESAEHSAAEASRRAAEAEDGRRILDALMEYIPEGLTIAEGSDLRIRMRSRYAEELSGHANISVEQLPLGEYARRMRLFDPTGQRELEPGEYPMARAGINGEVIENEECILQRPDGKRINLLINAGPIHEPSGTFSGAVVTWNDITERKRAEAMILANAAQIEAQHLLSQYGERERLQIARDLHDGPIQELIGITFTLQEAMERAAEPQTRADLAHTQHAIQDQVRELREVCNELRPPTLAPFGLEKALRAYLEGFQQTHSELKVIMNLVEDGQLLAEPVRLALYRIARELLNNVVRHSQASQVEVSFSMGEQRVELEVADDGCGFDPPAQWVALARQGHFGLVGIQERAEAVGGTVEVTTQPGVGVRVRVTVPV